MYKDSIENYLQLYFIMGSENCYVDPIHVLEEAIKGGVTCFQFREKGASALKGREKEELARMLQSICQKHRIPFIVNDDLHLAEMLKADGVHVGQQDTEISYVRKQFSKQIVGLSVHTIAEAIDAKRNEVDYIGVGPIYSTTTKVDAKSSIGPNRIRNIIKEGVDIPTVGIGGINQTNCDQVLEAGASGIAVISAISNAVSPLEAASQLRKKER
ncbi:thiamine phosphate synthase [Bacillus solimangrovi]|uniref:Thiamine-phosphate synthase n=1 Tax=Bacillus solimangrovi TaxID=1305675 RepID=A0A1E5LB53_9BACI|nr:thiamine phosphate synthase [Bacillus solimangrovi]OEH91306.1 thiamine-phosphate diphosphorylase [Bacillus solimangrovi]